MLVGTTCILGLLVVLGTRKNDSVADTATFAVRRTVEIILAAQKQLLANLCDLRVYIFIFTDTS